MSKARVDELFADIEKCEHVSLLRAKYSKEEIQQLRVTTLTLDRMFDFLVHDAYWRDHAWTERSPPSAWSVPYLEWLIEVTDCPRDYLRFRWRLPLSRAQIQRLEVVPVSKDGLEVEFPCTLLDWVCISSDVITDAAAVVDCLLRLGFRGYRSLGWCLAFHTDSLSPYNKTLAKRLLDAGAQLDWRLEFNPDCFTEWYFSRLRCRKQCWAVLGSWRHSPAMKHYLARDVMQMIARMIWEHRWDQ